MIAFVLTRCASLPSPPSRASLLSAAILAIAVGCIALATLCCVHSLRPEPPASDALEGGGLAAFRASVHAAVFDACTAVFASDRCASLDAGGGTAAAGAGAPAVTGGEAAPLERPTAPVGTCPPAEEVAPPHAPVHVHSTDPATDPASGGFEAGAVEAAEAAEVADAYDAAHDEAVFRYAMSHTQKEYNPPAAALDRALHVARLDFHTHARSDPYACPADAVRSS
jgi:hypothetical protein